ncbi:MAG: phosphoglycolate phosphatase [Robiginitomaculum sp.]|nr:phosphoglycolate phosphatase [Robiginitomaculum sp.]
MNGDYCNNDGARDLKRRIETYWIDKGYDVQVQLIEGTFMAAMRSARTDVRSDMVNGMPQRRAA